MSRQPTARAGKKLGRYRISRELGRGGMGVVYLAEDENTGRQIALKTTSVAGLGGAEKSRNQRRQRFVREVQALTQVSHDNVVHVIDAGEADDPDLGWLLFYSMEYVEGETLAQLVQRRGALEPGAAAAVCMQVAAGLGAAHKAGIVHRDVKPANIFISLDGRALIGDFGICKIEGQTQITRRDQLVGTPNYLAPEQILGDPVSPATDVFALGALYYVITMNRPLRSHVDAAALLASAQGNEPRDRMLAERIIPDPLRKVIGRCLEREPKKRWTDGQQLADALSEFATRIPSLRDETDHESMRDASSTSDRSSPFASLPSVPSSDVLDAPNAFANPNDVEAAARAMLDEVAQRDKKGDKPDRKPDRKAKDEDKPLPVAKTESTVMFNLRAMEAEQDKGKALPVAKTESTVIFKMRANDDAAANPGGRLDETQMGMHDDPTPVGGTETASSASSAANEITSDVVRPQPRVKKFRVEREGRSLPIKLPPLSRRTWIGISGAGGALAGLLLVLILAPPSYSAASDASAAVEDAARTNPWAEENRPDLCAKRLDDVATDDEMVARASRLRSQAKQDFEPNGKVTKGTGDKLLESVQVDPHNPETFWWLGKFYAMDAGHDLGLARQAYRCTCYVSKTNQYCDSVKKKPALLE